MNDNQLHTLRHMLGIDTRSVAHPAETRNYYCAEPDNAEMAELAALGMVEKYATQGGFEWWRCTRAGREAARASQKAMLYPKKRRRYLAFLSACDVAPDLTFREFLTEPFWKHARECA